MGFTSTIKQAGLRAASSLMGSKATILVMGNTVEQIPVQFNPAEYQITDGTAYNQKPRRKNDEPLLDFNGVSLSTLRVQLIFNSAEFTSAASLIKAGMALFTDEGPEDISKTISKISALTRIDGEKHQPPGCMFVWGSLQFAGYMQNVGVTYTMFDKTGRPLRATVDIVMQGFNNPTDEKSSPLMSPDRTKARTMTEDSSLWSLAEKEYGDAREWRRIAEANNIRNPLDIPVGRMLKVPSIND